MTANSLGEFGEPLLPPLVQAPADGGDKAAVAATAKDGIFGSASAS